MLAVTLSEQGAAHVNILIMIFAAFTIAVIILMAIWDRFRGR